jgi:hypothetical protein
MWMRLGKRIASAREEKMHHTGKNKYLRMGIKSA